mgnify:FL=1
MGSLVTIKKANELKIIREAGKRLGEILKILGDYVAPGISTLDLDRKAKELIEANGDAPAFLGYKASGMRKSYPATLCVSVNDEIVHGIPGDYILKDGDIVGLDLGLIREKLFVDAAITVAVGKVSSEDAKLIEDTKESLNLAIKTIRPGSTTGDIGAAIEEFVTPLGYGIVDELAGHGVGYAVHEPPFVPNLGRKGEGVKLLPGMVIAIEPMLNLGTHRIKLGSDGFTYKTRDGLKSAHFEHTVIITESGHEVVTSFT